MSKPIAIIHKGFQIEFDGRWEKTGVVWGALFDVIKKDLLCHFSFEYSHKELLLWEKKRKRSEFADMFLEKAQEVIKSFIDEDRVRHNNFFAFKFSSSELIPIPGASQKFSESVSK